MPNPNNIFHAIRYLQAGTGETVLMAACANGHDTVALLLLAAGAKIDTQNQQGMTALMRAVLQKCYSCVHLLLAKGANRDLRNNTGRRAIEQTRDVRMSAILIGLVR